MCSSGQGRQGVWNCHRGHGLPHVWLHHPAEAPHRQRVQVRREEEGLCGGGGAELGMGLELSDLMY